MKMIIINKKKGCLLKKLHLDKKTILFLKSNGLIEELSSANKIKYNDSYFVLEDGITLINLNNLQDRYNVLKNYLVLKKDSEFKNKKFILDNMEMLNSLKIDYPKEIVFYKNQMYDMNFIKKYFEIIKNNVYDNGVLIGKLVKNQNVYTLRRIN